MKHLHSIFLEKAFKQFLIDNGVAQKFINNYYAQNKRSINKYLMDDNVFPNDYVSNAFNWTFTLDGSVFWDDIDVKWINLFNIM